MTPSTVGSGGGTACPSWQKKVIVPAEVRTLSPSAPMLIGPLPIIGFPMGRESGAYDVVDGVSEQVRTGRESLLVFGLAWPVTETR
jgi:hypothetical protein